MDNLLFETLKKYVVPHGNHIYETAFDTDMAIMSEYPTYQHALPHWKCMLRFYVNLPRIYIPVK